MVDSSTSCIPLFWIATFWSILSALAIDIPQFAAPSSYLELKNVTISARKESDNYNELILGDGVTFGLQRSATDSNESLRLLEITNGSLIVQLVFSPSELFVDCDVSNSRQHIHRLTKHIGSKLHKTSKYIRFDLPLNESQELLDIDGWVDKCTTLHTDNLRHTTESVAEKVTNTIPQSIAVQGMSEPPKPVSKTPVERQRRGITDLIYPGKD